MELNIKATEAERAAVIKAIRKLNSVRHLSYMSQAMMVEDSGIKPSKIRIALQDLIDDKCIEQICVNGDKRVKRYYYCVTESGAARYPKI